jgi:hypothetical protein
MNDRHLLRKVSKWALLVVAGFYIYRHLVLLLLQGGRRGDLDILLLAGQRFWNHEPIYLLSDDSEHTKPPFLSPLFALLSQVPSNVMHAAWDVLMLALPFLVLHLWNQLYGRRNHWIPIAGSIALMGPLWFSEAGYGQYNLLLIAMTFLALRWTRDDVGAKSAAAGAIFWVSLVLKPTQLLFLPLFLVGDHAPRRVDAGRIFRFLGGIGLGLAANVALYLAFRSWPTLMADVAEWKQFIAQSQAKHILRPDNFGLPTQLARWGVPLGNSPGITVAGLALAMLASLRIRDLGQRINTVILIALIFSPMSWRQNYVMVLPLAYELIVSLKKPGSLAWKWVGLIALALVARFNEYWLGTSLALLWGTLAGPALGASIALAARAFSLTSSRLAENSDGTIPSAQAP